MTKRNKKLLITTIICVVLILVTIGAKILVDYGYNKFMHSCYPLAYTDYVEKYAKENNLDVYLVYSVIKTESSFNPQSESDLGARGLMQIMSDTFEWIKFRLGDGDEMTYDDMYDEELNIKYGTYLLGYLMKYYDNDITCAAAAYHAGTGSVDSWLEKSDFSDDGKTLKDIPTSDTEHYVNKITKAIETYTNLYSEGEQSNG